VRVLVLQKPRSSDPFDVWLRAASDDVEVKIVTGANTVRGREPVEPGTSRELLADYDGDAATGRIHEICEEWRPDVVFADAESDVLRAAEARTLFGIPGMRSSAAVLYRDKVLMKQLFAGLSIEAVDYRVPSNADDLLAACAKLGPVVLKPRDGGGSLGVHVFRTPGDARLALAAAPALLAELHRSRLILEPFVHGDEYHVDIVLRGGTPILISVSKYVAPPHCYRTHNRGSIMLDPGSPERGTLVRYGEEIVASMPAQLRPIALHLEVFKSAGGDFRAGEIACRGGGALIKDCIKHTYGVDPAWAACMLETGLMPDDRTYLDPTGPLSGYLMETSVPLCFDLDDPPSWMPKLKIEARKPTDLLDARYRKLVIEGDSHAQIEARMRTLYAPGTWDN
jgi:biotin carboxylase